MVMCARRLWTLIGGRGPLPERHVDAAPQRKLGAWSAQDVDTDMGRLVVALEEFTYLTVVFPVVPVSAFLDHIVCGGWPGLIRPRRAAGHR